MATNKERKKRRIVRGIVGLLFFVSMLFPDKRIKNATIKEATPTIISSFTNMWLITNPPLSLF